MHRALIKEKGTIVIGQNIPLNTYLSAREDPSLIENGKFLCKCKTFRYHSGQVAIIEIPTRIHEIVYQQYLIIYYVFL